MLTETKPSDLSDPDFLIYEGSTIPGVNPDQLGYFAASVFWRGAIRGWDLARRESERLKLGKYEEELRCFLTGRAFPTDAVLIVTVSSESGSVPDTLTTFPFLKGHESRFRQYKFTIPGITFQLFVGRRSRLGPRWEQGGDAVGELAKLGGAPFIYAPTLIPIAGDEVDDLGLPQ